MYANILIWLNQQAFYINLLILTELILFALACIGLFLLNLFVVLVFVLDLGGN